MAPVMTPVRPCKADQPGTRPHPARESRRRRATTQDSRSRAAPPSPSDAAAPHPHPPAGKGSAPGSGSGSGRGSGLSRVTRTRKVQVALLPTASVAAAVTWVSPRGKCPPEGALRPTPGMDTASSAVGAGYSTTPPSSEAVVTDTSAGHTSEGAVVSRTVTSKEQDAALPASSVADTVTEVVPRGKRLPGAWVEDTEGADTASRGGGREKTAGAPEGPRASTTNGPGHPTSGATESCTVTPKSQDAERPRPSVTVTVTGVVPRTKRVPESWL